MFFFVEFNKPGFSFVVVVVVTVYILTIFFYILSYGNDALNIPGVS